MWFYPHLSARLGTPMARIILVAYYAAMIALTLVFIFEADAAFRYAQI